MKTRGQKVAKCIACNKILNHAKGHFHSGDEGSQILCLECIAEATELSVREANVVWKFFRSITPTRFKTVNKDASLPSNIRAILLNILKPKTKEDLN